MKDVGFDLTDITGERRVHREVHEPQGVMAALGLLTPKEARAGAGIVLGIGSLLALETGLLSPVLMSTALALGFHLLGELDVEDTESVHIEKTEGMSERAVWEYLILNNEDEDVKKKIKKRKQREAKRKANSGGP